METKNTEHNLFNNPFINEARKNMPKEDLERYAKIGEEIYSIDFETAGTNLPEFMRDALLYILESLKSGLHPSMLDENEKTLLKELLGDKWYEKYGYVEQDLTTLS